MGFIKSFYTFKNFKFELVENKPTDKFESISENKDQALSILRKKDVSESDPTFASLRKEIEKIFKNLNYLGLMTKYIFEQEVSFQEIKDLLIWLKFNGGRLPQNPLEYKEFEDIKDATIKVDNNQRVKVIYNLLPSEQKKLAKHNPPFIEKALEIHRLGMIKEFGRKLSAHKTKEDLINYMDLFIDTNAKKITFDKVVKDLRNLNSEILIEDPDTGVIMAEILDFKTSRSTGSPDWCIVTGESSWNSYTKGTKRQFFLWDFSEERTSSLFMVGFTTNGIGQITNIHDKYDVSLGSIPEKIKTALKSIDLSTDPFEYKDKIMSNISKGLASEIEYPDENVIILRVKKEGFESFQSEGWVSYSPFPYGDEIPNFYFYVIYNFKYPLNDGRFCYGIESSDDGELVLVNIIDNIGNKGFIKSKSDDDDDDDDKGIVKIEGNLNDDFLTDLYSKGYIKSKDIEDILSEKKENYLNKIEKYAKGSEISSSYHDKQSEYINTSTDEGSTGSKWLFKIEHDDLSKFYTGIIEECPPQRNQNIHNFNLYCLIDLDESFRSPTFIRFIKLSEDSITLVYNINDGGKVRYNDVSELSEDLQEYIELGHMKIKLKSEYYKEISDKKKEIFHEASIEYQDEDVDLSSRALFDYLIGIDDLDKEDYEDEENPHRNVLIPNSHGHYELNQFTVYTRDMVVKGYGGKEWAIGSDEDANKSAQEYVESTLDELGLEGTSDWVWKEHIDSEGLADRYAGDSDYYEELFREDPEGYDITKIQLEGIEEKIDNSNEEVDSNNELKDKYEESKTKTDERLEKYTEFIESKLEKIDELQSDEIDDNDPDKERKYKRLEIIKERLTKRFEINKKRYEDLIEKYENVIETIEEKIETLEDLISEMEDEDNEDYWEFDENEIETKAESYAEDSKNEVMNDPVDFLKNMGYSNDTPHYDRNDNHQSVNDILKQFVDFEEVAKSIVDADGRGPQLSGYDGNENEHHYNGNEYYIYRTN